MNYRQVDVRGFLFVNCIKLGPPGSKYLIIKVSYSLITMIHNIVLQNWTNLENAPEAKPGNIVLKFP